MIYAKVRNDFTVYKNDSFIIERELIKDELYTIKEMEKYNIPFHIIDLVSYPKNKSYKIFGVRFNSNDNHLKECK